MIISPPYSGIIAASGASIDPDAAAFLLATGITDPTISAAINTLVVSAKANNWWTRCSAIYPYVGGTGTTCKYNLKDPRDLDAAFRITFGGGETFAANGWTGNGSTAYGETHLDASTLTLNDTHISVWSGTNSAVDLADIGCMDFPNQDLQIFIKGSGGAMSADQYAFAERLGPAVADSSGWFLSSRTSSSLFRVSRNGVSLASNTTTTGTLPARTIWLGAINSNVGAFPNTRQYRFHTIGLGISISLAATMFTDINTFQTAVRS